MAVTSTAPASSAPSPSPSSPSPRLPPSPQRRPGGGDSPAPRLFSPLTVAKFTEPQTPPDQPILRGLGWDIDSPYSGNRGELFPIGSFGHTGFTGTSVWIDPSTKTFVILLANSVHPDARPAITPLRNKVATIVAANVGIT